MLFEPELPEGFEYREDFLTEADERGLAAAIAQVTFSNFEMRGVVARRRVAFFGMSYMTPEAAPTPKPDFLARPRAQLAAWAGIPADDFVMALINEYPPGAPIGWHRDAPPYGAVAGISLLSACRMRLRPYVAPGAPVEGRRTATHELLLTPRSAYIMRGPARQAFEHSIPPVTALRYSITFRTVRTARARESH
jgi:alkylated DNA repair dioxygenase AlkB